MNDIPDWLTIGAEVVSWDGRAETEPGRVRTVARLTKTLVILDDGTRWNLKNLRLYGDRGYRSSSLYPAGDPAVADAAAKRAERDARNAIEFDLRQAAYWWASSPSVENVEKLRTAVLALAPHLGLTVTETDPARAELAALNDANTATAAHIQTGDPQ